MSPNWDIDVARLSSSVSNDKFLFTLLNFMLCRKYIVILKAVIIRQETSHESYSCTITQTHVIKATLGTKDGWKFIRSLARLCAVVQYAALLASASQLERQNLPPPQPDYYVQSMCKI